MPKDISRLIPIKKAITDIQKGLVIRTYYYRPQTLIKQLEKLKEEPNINYYGETPFFTEYETYLKTGDKSSFAKYFDKETWHEISTLENNPQINKHMESKFIYPLNGFFLSGDRIFLKNFKKHARELTKETTILPQNFSLKSNKAKIKETKYYNVTKVSNLISNFLNYYNPRKPKVVEIVKKLVGSDYIDESGIIHHCVFSERVINREKDLFLNILRSNINMFYSAMIESKKDISHLMFYLPYYLVEIFKMDVGEFENILQTYYFSDLIQDFIKSIKENKLSDNLGIFYSQIVNMPKPDLIKFISNTILKKELKQYDLDYIIMKSISMRLDVTQKEYDLLFYNFLQKYDIFDKNTLISELILHFFENNPPGLITSLYLFFLERNLGNIPIMFVREFKGVEPERGSILFMLNNSKETNKYILNILPLEKIESKTKVYIPIMRKSNIYYLETKKIPFRLSTFHLATLNSDIIKNSYEYIELEVPSIYKINNDLCFVNI